MRILQQIQVSRLLLAFVLNGPLFGIAQQPQSAPATNNNTLLRLNSLRIERLSKAKEGDAKAQFAIGRLYHIGDGVQIDYIEAAKWYRKSADQGYPEAQCALGHLYYCGLGIPQNKIEAARWYRKSADQGYAMAQGFLGKLYASGEGVPKDEAQAYQWLILAAAQGTNWAKEIYERLEETLSLEQRAEGQRLARNFKPKSAFTK